MAIDSESYLELNPPEANFRVRYGSDPLQFADVRVPSSEKPWPVVMNIHGGFWRSKYDLLHANHFCAALTQAGLATFNVEYRRAGNPGGGWPGTLSDIREAHRYLHERAKEQGFDTSRIAVVGHSAGGHLAMCLAAYESSVRSVMSLAGVLHLYGAYELHLSNDAVAEFLGGTPEEIPDRYREASPFELNVGATQVVITGSADDTVPPEFSREYSQKKGSAGEKVKLVEIANADHFDLIDPRTKPFEVVLASIQRLLA